MKCECGLVVKHSLLAEHKTGDDCPLNFCECPLFSVNMCDSDCTGRVRRDALARHISTDETIVTTL
eukprot:gene40757-50432_t